MGCESGKLWGSEGKEDRGYMHMQSLEMRERGWTGMAQSRVDSGKNLEFKL